MVPIPADADQQREQLVRRLAAKDSDIDLIGMDVIWTAEFANAGWIRDRRGQAGDGDRGATRRHGGRDRRLPGQASRRPLNSNTQLLWYRNDLTKTRRRPGTR